MHPGVPAPTAAQVMASMPAGAAPGLIGQLRPGQVLKYAGSAEQALATAKAVAALPPKRQVKYTGEGGMSLMKR